MSLPGHHNHMDFFLEKRIENNFFNSVAFSYPENEFWLKIISL